MCGDSCVIAFDFIQTCFECQCMLLFALAHQMHSQPFFKFKCGSTVQSHTNHTAIRCNTIDHSALCPKQLLQVVSLDSMPLLCLGLLIAVPCARSWLCCLHVCRHCFVDHGFGMLQHFGFSDLRSLCHLALVDTISCNVKFQAYAYACPASELQAANCPQRQLGVVFFLSLHFGVHCLVVLFVSPVASCHCHRTMISYSLTQDLQWPCVFLRRVWEKISNGKLALLLILSMRSKDVLYRLVPQDWSVARGSNWWMAWS